MNAPRGFTLLEMLVVTVILAMLFALLTGGVSLGLRGWGRQSRAADALATHLEIESILRRLVAGAQASGDSAATGEGRMVFTGLEDRLLFDATLRLGSGKRQNVEISLGVDRAKRLMLRWRVLHTPGCLPAEPMHEEVIANAIDALHLRYWSAGAAAGWHTGWSGKGPPALVGITVVPVDEKPWAEIAVHPFSALTGDDAN